MPCAHNYLTQLNLLLATSSVITLESKPLLRPSKCKKLRKIAFLLTNSSADPDPIWICMEIGICPIADSAAGKILKFSISPTSGPQGTKFTFTIVYQITNTTGTGELELDVSPPDADSFGKCKSLSINCKRINSYFPQGDDGLLIQVAPGTYQAASQFTATPSENEPFSAGTYQAFAFLCEGTCGSDHSHSFTMDQKTLTFSITQ